MIQQVGFGTSSGSLQCKIVPGWFYDGIYCLVHSLLYCPSDTEKANSPFAIFLRKGEIVTQFRRTENAPCQPIVAEMACEAGQVKDVYANAQDGHHS